MPQYPLGKRTWDHDYFIENSLIPASGALDLGSVDRPFRNIYLSGSAIVPTLDLANNTYLKSLNFAGSGYLNLLKADVSNNTVLNAATGNVIDFAVNSVVIGTASSTALTYPVFNLSDGADKNHDVTSFASGTAYNLTATPAQLVFGTSNAAVVLDKAGTYLLLSSVNLEFNGATFAANRTVTIQLNRTNNTPAALTGSATAVGTGIVTTVSSLFARFNLPPIVYTTSNTNDIVTVFGSVSVVPTAGNLQATEANIIAVRLF